MADQSERCSDSQSEISNVSDELSSLESSYSESETAETGSGTKNPSAKGSNSSTKRPQVTNTTARGSRKKKAKTTDKSVARGISFAEMDELSSWVFSAEEAKRVESERQKDNFGLLIVGFCRKFATLSKECYSSNVLKERKAAFSVAWMKMFSNFQPGKKSQERIVIERCLPASKSFSHEDVHSVLSVIHEMVYTLIHDRVRSRKEHSTAESSSSARQLSKESDDTLYRSCGAALQRMLKLRRESLAGKKKRIKPSSEKRPIMTKELEILEGLVMKDKSGISQSSKSLDAGKLIFPRDELIFFLRSVDNEVREFTTDSNLRKYPSKFLQMCQNCVKNNERLETDFRELVGSLLPEVECAMEASVVDRLYRVLVSKLANTRINEFLNAKVERDLKVQGKVVDADEMLRPKLKSYAIVSKRKKK